MYNSSLMAMVHEPVKAQPLLIIQRSSKYRLSFIVRQNTTIINNSSTPHVQMGLLVAQVYYRFWLVQPSSGNTYR
jgi:hypothetical protein